MRPRTTISPEDTEFVILCFEGPDSYCQAGGLGVRVNNLSVTLAKLGFTTHLFFVGDPELQAEEVRCRGKLTLHRWCQWISKYYPNGVYEGENEKLYDFDESIPWFVNEKIVKPALKKGKLVVILGEEWHTAEAMCRLSDILHSDGNRDRAVMFWNANNTFSFHRVNWGRLNYASTLTTVSRYMKHAMRQTGLNPLVIPNGIPQRLLRKVQDIEADRIRKSLNADLILCKVARWDPAKGWDQAIETVSLLRERGWKTVLLARGGDEPYGQELMQKARSLGLKVREANVTQGSSNGYVTSLQEAASADIVDLRFRAPLDFLRVLYRASDAVLANSGHEPFGIVGLEAMAAGGVAFTGCTGEDYAISFINSIVLETGDPSEIVGYVTYLRAYPEESLRIRKAARANAHYFTWEATVRNLIRKLENQSRLQGALGAVPTPAKEQFALTALPSEFLATRMKSATRESPVLHSANPGHLR